MKNRNEDYLRFEDAARNDFRISSNSLASKFEPVTELEKEIDVVRVSRCVNQRFSKRVR